MQEIVQLNNYGLTQCHDYGIDSIVILGNNKMITVSRDGYIKIWKIPQMKLVHCITNTNEHNNIFSAICDIKSSKHLYTGSGSMIKQWSIQKQQPKFIKVMDTQLNNIQKHNYLMEIIYHKNIKYICVTKGREEFEVQLYSVKDWQLKYSFSGHTDIITKFVYLKKYGIIVTVSKSKEIRILDLNSNNDKMQVNKQSILLKKNALKGQIQALTNIDNEIIIGGSSKGFLKYKITQNYNEDENNNSEKNIQLQEDQDKNIVQNEKQEKIDIDVNNKEKYDIQLVKKQINVHDYGIVYLITYKNQYLISSGLDDFIKIWKWENLDQVFSIKSQLYTPLCLRIVENLNNQSFLFASSRQGEVQCFQIQNQFSEIDEI